MYFALLAVMVKGVVQAGGVARTWEINDESGRIEFFKHVLFTSWGPLDPKIWGGRTGGP